MDYQRELNEVKQTVSNTWGTLGNLYNAIKDLPAWIAKLFKMVQWIIDHMAAIQQILQELHELIESLKADGTIPSKLKTKAFVMKKDADGLYVIKVSDQQFRS